MKKEKNTALKIVFAVLAFAFLVLSALIFMCLWSERKSSDVLKRLLGVPYIGSIWIRLIFCLGCLLGIALLIYAISFIVSFYKERNEAIRLKEDKTETTYRFESLREIDSKMASAKPEVFNDSISLSEICVQFRNYAASRFGLYYDLPTVRCFVSSLPVTKLLIMQGISGTGKTSLAWAFGEFIGRPSAIVPVQPSWKEKTDLLGYFNEFTDRFNETEFLRKLYEANYSESVNITVLDEMNIARVEYYFAEFLSLLEIRQSDGRYISLTSGGWPTDPAGISEGRIRLPENMWYIGTANNDDSTMAISDKVYDRAMVLDLDRRAEPFKAPETEPIHLKYTRIIELGEEAQKKYSISEETRNNLSLLDKFLMDNLGISFGNRIMRQIEAFVPVYVSAGGTEEEALDMMISRKVLRKLESKNPMVIKKYSAEFNSCLDGIFGGNSMPLCRKAFVKYSF